METTSWSTRRPLTIGLLGLGAALTWTALAFFFGGSEAHAVDESEGLLGNLTSTATSAVGGVADEISDVTTQATEAVAPVTPAVATTVQQASTQVVTPVAKAIASAPVVRPSVESAKELVSSVAETSMEGASPVTTVAMTAATAVTTPVAHALDDEPLTQTANSVLGSLEPMPILGDTLAGLNPTVIFGVTKGDVILGSLGELVTSTTATIAAMDATNPLGGEAVVRTADLTDASSARGALADGVASASNTSVLNGPVLNGAALNGAVVEGTSDPHTPGTPLQPSSSVPATSGASAGGSSSPIASMTHSRLFSSLGSARTVGAQNDALPVSPTFGTDVSPD